MISVNEYIRPRPRRAEAAEGQSAQLDTCHHIGQHGPWFRASLIALVALALLVGAPAASAEPLGHWLASFVYPRNTAPTTVQEVVPPPTRAAAPDLNEWQAINAYLSELQPLTAARSAVEERLRTALAIVEAMGQRQFETDAAAGSTDTLGPLVKLAGHHPTKVARVLELMGQVASADEAQAPKLCGSLCSRILEATYAGQLLNMYARERLELETVRALAPKLAKAFGKLPEHLFEVLERAAIDLQTENNKRPSQGSIKIQEAAQGSRDPALLVHYVRELTPLSMRELAHLFVKAFREAHDTLTEQRLYQGPKESPAQLIKSRGLLRKQLMKELVMEPCGDMVARLEAALEQVVSGQPSELARLELATGTLDRLRQGKFEVLPVGEAGELELALEMGAMCDKLLADSDALMRALAQ